MPTIAESAPLFGDLVKREYDKLLTRETVTISGAAGDSFALGLVVSEDAGSAVPYDPEKGVYGVLIGGRKIAAGETGVTAVVLARGPAVVALDSLVFPDGTTAAEKAAAIEALKGLFIVPRKTA